MKNIADILREAYQRWNTESFIYEKVGERFISYTFGEFIENAFYLVKGLKELNLDDSKFMIYSENSVYYLLCDTAITGFIGTSIPIDKNYKMYDLKHAIIKTGPNIFFYSQSKRDVVDELRYQYSTMNYLEMEKEIPKIIEIGKRSMKNKKDLLEVKGIDPRECSKIIFTTGSSSKPKPVMLSQENIIKGYFCCATRIPMNENQRDYLFLPLSHIFAIGDYYYSLISGKKIYLSSNVKNIVQELQEVKPNFLISVPLICERLYNAADGNCDKLKKIYGENLKYILVGGAKVSTTLKKKYYEAGISLKEVYGMSEMASVLVGNSIYDDDINSTGTLYEEYEYKIINSLENGIGELVVKKKDPFLGYYNDIEATKRVLDEEGFYHTGDLGKIIDNKFYYVRRKDHVIVLPNGEKVNPSELEELVKERCHVDKVTIYLEGKRLNAFIYADIVRNYNREIEAINNDLPPYKHIVRYEIKENSGRIK